MRSTKLLIVLLLSIAGTSVLADTGDYFSLASNDQSIYYLQWFFGDVGGVFGVSGAANQQFLGTLMRYLNLGVLSFATLMITYTILMGVVKTAQDAAFMGREGKSGWTAIRSALGIALLVPGTTGYSLIQVFIMWVVVQGVGLADTIFVKAVQFLQMNKLPSAPGSSEDDTETTTNYPRDAIKYGPRDSMVPVALSVISSKLCSKYFNDIVDDTLTKLKLCLNSQSTQPSLSGLVDGSAGLIADGSAPANSVCNSLFDDWGISKDVRTRLTTSLTSQDRNAILQLLNRNLSPRVAFYLGYKDQQIANGGPFLYKSTHPSLATIVLNNALSMPYAVAGIKNGTEIIAVCGAYPIGKQGPIMGTGMASEDYKQLNQRNFSAFKAVDNALNAIANILYNKTAKKDGRLRKIDSDVNIAESSFDETTIAPYVQDATTAWRTQTAMNLDSLANTINDRTMSHETASTVSYDKGWILAGGYYWLMSDFTGKAQSQSEDFVKIFPLCGHKSDFTQRAVVTENRHQNGAHFPVRCLASDGNKPVCRQEWNQYSSTGEDASCSAAGAGGPSTLNDEAEFGGFLNSHLQSTLKGEDNVTKFDEFFALTDEDSNLSESVLASFKQYVDKVNKRLSGKKKKVEALVEDDIDANNNLINNQNEAADTTKLYSELAALSGLIGVIGTGLIAGAGAAGGVIAAAITGCAVAIILAGFIAVAELFKISPNTDPMTILFNLGHALSAMAITSYVAAGAAIYYFAIGTGTMNSMHGISEANKLSLSWFAPLFQVVVIAAMANGGMLSIYVPMIPLMIYLFAVMGWLITVLEAMVAGPLIAMGVTHPQGHDLLGKSEQAMMMLISVFLRPALITIGFFASMLMLRVSFNIARAMLTPYSDMFTLSSMNPVIGIAFFMTLTVIVIGVIETAFSLINVIPERVMQWIGVQGMAQDLSRATMQMVQGATKAAGQSAGESMTRQGQNEEKKSLQGSEGSASTRDN